MTSPEKSVAQEAERQIREFRRRSDSWPMIAGAMPTTAAERSLLLCEIDRLKAEQHRLEAENRSLRESSDDVAGLIAYMTDEALLEPRPLTIRQGVEAIVAGGWRLRKQRDEMAQAITQSAREIRRLEKALESERQRRAQVEQVLREYSEHHDYCTARYKPVEVTPNDYSCNCGLDAALKALEDSHA